MCRCRVLREKAPAGILARRDRRAGGRMKHVAWARRAVFAVRTGEYFNLEGFRHGYWYPHIVGAADLDRLSGLFGHSVRPDLRAPGRPDGRHVADAHLFPNCS